jgi:hypothetical protein
MEVSGQLRAPTALPQGGEVALSIHCMGHWMDPRGGLDIIEQRKLFCFCLESKPDSLVMQSLA